MNDFTNLDERDKDNDLNQSLGHNIKPVIFRLLFLKQHICLIYMASCAKKNIKY